MESRRGFISVLVSIALLSDVHCLTVKTSVGDIIGFEDTWRDKLLYKFRGIPYAEAPVGELRFSPPVPKAPFTEPFNADRFGKSCPQDKIWLAGLMYSSEEKDLNESEDCLSLNIYVPSGGEEKKAVMVWIHGGAFTVGASLQYDGSKMAAAGDVIVVTINYRLALLGLFTTDDDDDDIAGNQLLLDQQLALKWVQKNINAFGGDKDRVTIFGESAGGASVTWQMLAPSNKGLFQRVIAESGTPLSPWSFPDPKTADEYQKGFVEKVGCSNEDSNKVVSCLRALPAQEFSASFHAYPHGELNSAFPTGPRVDGSHIPFSPKSRVPGERMEDQRFFESLDFLLGAVKYEGSPLVTGLSEPVYKEKTNKSLYDGVPMEAFQYEVERWGVGDGAVTKDVAKALWWLYGTSENGITDGLMSLKGFMEYIGDAFFYDGIGKFVRRHASDDAATTGSTYLYSFLPMHTNKVGTVANMLEVEPCVDGAIHCSELSFLFGRTESMENEERMDEGENELSDGLITYWTNFAKTGNPNKPVQVPHQWPEYNLGEEKFMEFDIVDKQADYKTQAFYRNKYASFWADILPNIQRTVKNTSGINQMGDSHGGQSNVKTEL
ncbi:fatty acyl-CoA hydrolase precursor, medium chain-like [Lineus longissimus]|uniref:fatty acyl-CoA hydrolase precursor, medium chain-like n=1 Tax=Lineus longissimus TaxID=88925 RepID=UPI00315DC112